MKTTVEVHGFLVILVFCIFILASVVSFVFAGMEAEKNRDRDHQSHPWLVIGIILMAIALTLFRYVEIAPLYANTP